MAEILINFSKFRCCTAILEPLWSHDLKNINDAAQPLDEWEQTAHCWSSCVTEYFRAIPVFDPRAKAAVDAAALKALQQSAKDFALERIATSLKEMVLLKKNEIGEVR